MKRVTKAGCDHVSSTKFNEVHASHLILATVNDVFVFHKYTNHVCLFVAIHESDTNFLPSSDATHNSFELSSNRLFSSAVNKCLQANFSNQHD